MSEFKNRSLLLSTAVVISLLGLTSSQSRAVGIMQSTVSADFDRVNIVFALKVVLKQAGLSNQAMRMERVLDEQDVDIHVKDVTLDSALRTILRPEQTGVCYAFNHRVFAVSKSQTQLQKFLHEPVIVAAYGPKGCHTFQLEDDPVDIGPSWFGP